VNSIVFMFYIIHHPYNIKKPIVLQNVILSTASTILMYLTIKHTHPHYYIWLQIHNCITLTMNVR